MADRLLVYLTGNGHAAYRSASGTLELEARFSADEAGLAAFREHLRRRGGALVHVVADVAGEDFHEDQIPYLRGADRQAVIDRRLAQRYRDTRLAAALSLGYAAGERRTERLLLASFTNTQQFGPWLDALAESGARLSGVYSVPLLAPALAARLGVRGGRAFVVTANSTGLRQCFVDEGRLRFARLERVADVSPEALATFVCAEMLRLVQFLGTLRTLPREGPPVQVLVVAPPGQRAVFEQVLVSDARLSFLTFEQAEAARKIGLKREPAEAAGEHLFLHLAARHPPAEQFARLEDRRSFVLWRLQRAVMAVGAAAFALCGAYAAWLWADLYGLRQQITEQHHAAQQDTQQYERITASFPVTQTTTDNLKATVVEYNKLVAQSAQPEPALVYLSRIVDRFPQIELESVQWRVGKPDEGAAAKSPAAPAPAAAANGAAKPAALPETLQVLEVSGRVSSAKRSDYRAITAQVQEFADALRQDPAWRVLRTQLPFDITSEGTLTGDIGSTEGSESPRFTIVLGRAVP